MSCPVNPPFMKVFFPSVFLLLLGLLTACSHGDKASAIGATFDGEEDFVNASFSGNKINPDQAADKCALLSADVLADMVGISADKISANPNPATGGCGYIVMYDEDRDYSTAGFGLLQEVTGDEADWKDNWSVEKSISKTAEWVPGLGMAAMWKPRNRELKVKYDGYTLQVNAPAGPGKDESETKDWAIAMVKKAGFE
jgi:hypothetical protein